MGKNGIGNVNADQEDMERVSRWFIAVKKLNAWLQHACEAMPAIG